MTFNNLQLSETVASGRGRCRLRDADADPGTGDPRHPEGRDILGCAQTGHRQDGLVHLADDRHSRRRPGQGAHAAIADPRADARAGGSGRRELRYLRQVPQADQGADHRRRVDGRPDQGAGARRRRADRHAGPAARRLRPRPPAAQRRAHPGDRRGRPDARHGLHPRRRAHRLAGLADAPDAAVLGDHAAGDPPAGRCLPQQSQGDHRGAAVDAGGDGDPGTDRGRPCAAWAG